MVNLGLSRRARSATPKHERRKLRERGASMVEFAIIAPLFFLVVFGGIEVGLMFRSYLALEDVTRTAGRVASIERNNVDADTAILASLENSTSLLQGEVQSVVIFRARSLDAELPAGCDAGSVPGVCNHYTVASSDFSTATSTGDLWPSTSRTEDDNIGIHIEFDYRYATGFLDELTLSSTTVQAIEQDLS